MLPDDILLAIFDFIVEKGKGSPKVIEEWQTLVHVCRRWRSLVFGSPRRLNLRLVCSTQTPARDTLDVWPALPLFISCDKMAESVDDIIAVLEHSDRVREILMRPFFRRVLSVPFQMDLFIWGTLIVSSFSSIVM